MRNPKPVCPKNSLNVLLIEDDPDLSSLIIDYMEMEKINCENAPNGMIGLKLAKQDDDMLYDCIILDINLPLLDGLTLCEELRKNKINTPIIMLTARDAIDDKLDGFAAGTNDYLCKPFEIRELIARIRAITKNNLPSEELCYFDLIMNLQNGKVTRAGKEIILTQTEWKILRLLLLNSPNVVSKKKIISEIWGADPPDSDSLKVHMHNLRKSLDVNRSNPILHTMAGHGYYIASE